MTISVYIPTIPNHLKYLDKILNTYLHKSTVLPDQIVVSISNFKNVEMSLYEGLKNKYKKVLFLEHSDIKLAGPNRQYSKEYCNSDIILYQDSDDLPHIQRIEIVKYFFENYDIIHLHHSYFNITENINLIEHIGQYNYNEDLIDVKSIKFIESKDFYNNLYPNKSILDSRDTHTFNKIFNTFKPHHGALAVKKEVFEKVNWKHRDDLFYSPGWDNRNYKGAEDYEFMMDVIFNYNKTVFIDGKIYFYYG